MIPVFAELQELLILPSKLPVTHGKITKNIIATDAFCTAGITIMNSCQLSKKHIWILPQKTKHLS